MSGPRNVSAEDHKLTSPDTSNSSQMLDGTVLHIHTEYATIRGDLFLQYPTVCTKLILGAAWEDTYADVLDENLIDQRILGTLPYRMDTFSFCMHKFGGVGQDCFVGIC